MHTVHSCVTACCRASTYMRAHYIYVHSAVVIFECREQWRSHITNTVRLRKWTSITSGLVHWALLLLLIKLLHKVPLILCQFVLLRHRFWPCRIIFKNPSPIWPVMCLVERQTSLNQLTYYFSRGYGVLVFCGSQTTAAGLENLGLQMPTLTLGLFCDIMIVHLKMTWEKFSVFL